MKKISTIILVCLLLLFFAACGTLNIEKDAARVVAKVGETNITKAQFNDLLSYYKVVYAVNRQALPTGAELKTLKQQMLEDMVNLEAEYMDAKERGFVVADSVYQSNVQRTLNYIEQTVDSQSLETFYSENGTSREALEAFLNEYYKKIAYASELENQFFAIFAEDKTLLEAKVAKVNGQVFPMKKFLYYLMNSTINAYVSGQSMPQNADEMQAYYRQILQDYAQTEAYYKEAKARKIDISEEEIIAKQNQVNFYLTLLTPDEESRTSILHAYILSPEDWQTYSKEYATMLVAKDKITQSFQDEIKVAEPTAKEIKTYYEQNIGIKKNETTYAKHILFLDTNEADAKICADRAKAGENFDALIEEYKSHPSVLEVSDLGRFAKAAMVEPFAVAALSLEPGQVSNPVKTQYGYHVIYVYAPPGLEESTEQIKQTLSLEKQMDELTKKESAVTKKAKVKAPKEIKDILTLYLDSLHKKYHIKTYPSRL